jgi:hypothetical protein
MTGPTDSGAFTGRAFKIHFRLDTDLARGVCRGRIEHLRSGDAAHFMTAQEMLTFVEFWLNQSMGIAQPPSEVERS